MLISLKNHVALITGGSQRLGRAMGMQFAASGTCMVLLARRQVLFDEAAQEIAAATGAKVKAYACDVSDLGQKEFANVAGFLASDAAYYVTGVPIKGDGGLSPVLEGFVLK